jgi:hypothetical protein
MDGPVITAAQAALKTGEVERVLIWVRASDEPSIKAAFAAARKDRAGQQAYLETVVRLHRASENAPYEGIKPAGLDLGPAIPAADSAAASGTANDVMRVLHQAVAHGVTERLNALNAARKYDPKDVEAGRKYVRTYVEFVHYVDGLHKAAGGAPAGHAAAHEH